MVKFYSRLKQKPPVLDLEVDECSFNHSLPTYGKVHKNRDFILYSWSLRMDVKVIKILDTKKPPDGNLEV